MSRRPLRVATTPQLARSAREAGFEVTEVTCLPSLDFHRSISDRMSDGPRMRALLEERDIELVLDFNTELLTLLPDAEDDGQASLTTAAMGIPYAAVYLDPVTSTMHGASWTDHWQLLESPTWIKCIPDRAHAEELMRLGATNVLHMPMAITNGDFDRSPLPEPDGGPVLVFMGHPASGWFASNQTVPSSQLLAGFTAAAVKADMSDVPFHRVYFDLYGFGENVSVGDSFEDRARKSSDFYNQKFTFHAFQAIQNRDRYARFLTRSLGGAFELVGDHWGANYGLPHAPREWDMGELHARMRRVPINLNLFKGSFEGCLIVRNFEVPAHGGFLLTLAREELVECFVPGEECGVFRGEQDLLEKVQYYLENRKRREEIARAGQERTLAEHTYAHRFQSLVKTLRDAGVLPKSGVATEVAGEPSGRSRSSNIPAEVSP